MKVEDDGALRLPADALRAAGLPPGAEVALEVQEGAILLRQIAPPPAQDPVDPVRRILLERFGFAAFRPQQEDIIRSVLSGTPTLGIMPTSAGKSLCYQLPAVLLPGLTLVVSPLIALMQDQVHKLKALGIEAYAVHGGMEREEQLRAYRAVQAGRARLLYVAPERLRSADFRTVLGSAHIDLLAVDEAHCLSQWGHDFRPDYRLIASFVEEIRAPRLLALTATAPPAVRKDIEESLGIRKTVVGALDRPNLRYGVLAVRTEAERRAVVLARLQQLDKGSAVLYAPTRAQTESWAGLLQGRLGRTALAYHAGMEAEQRATAHAAFMSGEAPLIVATTAFGMGVDKPDIRAVLHLGLPDSVEAYLQEAGRAGRDGLPAWALIISILGRDAYLRRDLLRRETPDYAWMRLRLAEASRLEAGARWQIQATTNEERVSATLLLSNLVELGLAASVSRGRDAETVRLLRPITAADVLGLVQDIEARRRAKGRRFDGLVQYAETAGCRRDYFAAHFGAPKVHSKPDVCCDRCHPDVFALTTTVEKASGKRASSARMGGARPATSDLDAGGKAVLQRLRLWRRETAAGLRRPAYMVASDRVLEAIATALPKTPQELAAVPGIGPQRLATFGEAILRVVVGRRDAG
ncbi:MAG: RecQ family ATP-dependent DNA helicase [Thermaerobacter sp.]|nr:RecQ family ATP-dependent DNA helicase [Thermaerobacter sp.]